MELYNIYWYDCYGNRSLQDTTNDVNKWLEENNKQRIADGEEPEELSDFDIDRITVSIYSKEK
jgi:hypothetical protein